MKKQITESIHSTQKQKEIKEITKPQTTQSVANTALKELNAQLIAQKKQKIISKTERNKKS